MNENEAIKMLEIQKTGYGCKEYQKPLMHAYEMAIKALEEIQQYRAIGTVEECRAAVEKQNPQKPEIVRFGIEQEEAVAYCQTCGHPFGETKPALCQNIRYIVFEVKVNGKKSACPECGQAIDWRDIELERNVSKVSHKKA